MKRQTYLLFALNRIPHRYTISSTCTRTSWHHTAADSVVDLCHSRTGRRVRLEVLHRLLLKRVRREEHDNAVWHHTRQIRQCGPQLAQQYRIPALGKRERQRRMCSGMQRAAREGGNKDAVRRNHVTARKRGDTLGRKSCFARRGNTRCS